MFRISKDSIYYLTSVANNRLPIFQTEKFKKLMCGALDEARTSASLLLFAYVIMPDHIHALIGSQRKPSEVLRYVNGIASRRRTPTTSSRGRRTENTGSLWRTGVTAPGVA